VQKYYTAKHSKRVRRFNSYIHSYYLPYSGQWNDYNPFREIKEIEIDELKEIPLLRHIWLLIFGNFLYDRRGSFFVRIL